MGRKLYVGNLPYQVGEAELQELFSQAGSVESVHVMRDMATGRARGFAFVEMATDEEAQKAATQFNQVQPRRAQPDGERGAAQARAVRWLRPGRWWRPRRLRRWRRRRPRREPTRAALVSARQKARAWPQFPGQPGGKGPGPFSQDPFLRGNPVTVRFAALIVATALAAACQKTPAQPAVGAGQRAPGAPAASSTPAANAQQAVKPVPAQLPEVIARVNGDVIPRNEFERALANLEAQAGGPVPPERRDVIYRQVLDQLVAFRLLTQESAARKVAVPNTEIDARVGQIRGQFPNEQAYTAALAQRGMTPDKLREDIRRQIAAMKLVETTVVPTVNVGEPEIEAFYKQNPDKFQEPEAVHAAHILIRAPQGADAAARQKARAEAQGVLASAKKKGADFAALAKQHSQDQGSAVNGGDLGFVPRGQTAPEFEQAAFALKPGELSGVVESPFGFHVIKAFEHRAGRTVPLAEVKDRVGEFLKQQQVQEKTNALVGQLKAKGKVEILI